ncbi:flagellar filament capping protein FliD [Arthrobacter sp. N199823]|uniref:flagellar filament capping protein FliD n=1 Tax=Arthrobacter sp. N199823 TaxID=2058895 RepID=UPI000CE34293|nr:flagellar filament capping protein FliD [Arthrobacter sp. N199823]
MGMGIDGLTSGLDTTAIINALIAAEARPQTLMKGKVVTDTALVTAMQALNTKFAALTTQAAALAKAGGLDMYQATSSSDAITAKIGAGAQATSLDLTVNKLAQAHSMVSAPMKEWPTTPAVMTFAKADGTKTEVSAETGSLDDMAYAINHSAAGISAVKVASGVDVNGDPQFRLQLTAKDTGTANAFTAHQGTVAEVEAGTAVSLAGVAGSATLRTGQDAQVTLWAGTAAEQSITSASNTFAAIAPGIDITVNKLSPDPVAVTVSRDAGKVTAAAKELASAVNVILGSIFTQSTVTSGSGTGGTASAKGGLFTGERTVSDAKTKLFTAATAPVDGLSPATIGINTTKNGDLAFDADVFAAAYAKDPVAAEKMLQTIASRVAETAKSISDPIDGALTQRVKGQESIINDLNAQIVDWDLRLANRRSSLQAVYTSLEVQMSKMQSQQSWLTAQISSMDAASSQK